MQSDVAVSFGIGRLLDDVEAELFVRDKFGDAFLDHNAIAENALAIGADEVPAVGCLRRIRQAQPEDPVIRPIGNFRMDNTYTYQGKAKEGEEVRTELSRGAQENPEISRTQKASLALLSTLKRYSAHSGDIRRNSISKKRQLCRKRPSS